MLAYRLEDRLRDEAFPHEPLVEWCRRQGPACYQGPWSDDVPSGFYWCDIVVLDEGRCRAYGVRDCLGITAAQMVELGWFTGGEFTPQVFWRDFTATTLPPRSALLAIDVTPTTASYASERKPAVPDPWWDARLELPLAAL